MSEALDGFINRVEELLDRFEHTLPLGHGDEADWSAHAFRWQQRGSHYHLEPVRHPHRITLDALLGIERQKGELLRNTLQFVRGVPANNALLWGSRGTGKSSLVKALLNRFAAEGLRLVEVEPMALHSLPDIVDILIGRPERFIIFCDDLSFEADDPGYKALKSILDGSISATPENILLYATSNRRHLLPEFMSENRAAEVVEGELHLADATEEKISLSERFGLWLSFHPFNQEQYLEIVDYWLKRHHCPPLDEEGRLRALRWAHQRASRSGRSAWQFARDEAGRRLLQQREGNLPIG